MLCGVVDLIGSSQERCRNPTKIKAPWASTQLSGNCSRDYMY